MIRVLPVVMLLGCSEVGLDARPDPVVPGETDSPDVEPREIPPEVGRGRVVATYCLGAEPEVGRADIEVVVHHDWGEAVAWTDAEGRAVLDGVPAGTWLLEARRGARRDRREVRVRPDQTTEVEVEECLSARPVLLAHSVDGLYTLDLETYQAERVGGWAAGSITDIAVDAREGRAYAWGVGGVLYDLDVETAALTERCDVAIGGNALTATREGLLVGNGPEIHRVDPETCEADLLARVPGVSSAGDLVRIGPNRVLWAVNGAIIEVNTRTGRVLRETRSATYYGLARVDGRTLGFWARGDVVEIDLATGARTFLNSDDIEWWGAAGGPMASP